eukprot:gene32656-42296_t
MSEGGWTQIDFREIELGEQIGGGGVGVIYKGYFRSQPVALKTLFDSRISDELRSEYMNELLVMSKVKHSNIVGFVGACMTPPNLCFVMELCECSLYKLLHVERYRFSMRDNIQMAIDVASAMEYLHSLSPPIIHRDLKSLNILKAFNGSLKICDFGLVKNKNTTAGTPAYMAPELLENRSYNKSVDVYAFGILLWELLSGSIPFQHLSIADIRQRVLSEDRPPTNYAYTTGRNLRLINSCWSHDAKSRPTFTEVVDELIAIEQTLPAESDSKTAFLDDSLEDLVSPRK